MWDAVPTKVGVFAEYGQRNTSEVNHRVNSKCAIPGTLDLCSEMTCTVLKITWNKMHCVCWT